MVRNITYIVGIIMGCIITAGGGYLIYQCYKGLNEYFTLHRAHNVPSAITAAGIALLAFFIAGLLFTPDKIYRQKWIRILAIIFGFVFGIAGVLAIILFGFIFVSILKVDYFSTFSATLAVIAGIITVLAAITSFTFFRRGLQARQPEA